MTKEELKQEAEKYINNKQKPLTKYDLVAFAEPREKEIKILGERCLQLQKDKGNLIDKVAELEQKLEQIKNEKFEKALSQIKHDREVVIEYNEKLQDFKR